MADSPASASQDTSESSVHQTDSGKGKQAKPRASRKKEVPHMRLAELGMKGAGFVKNVKEAGFGFINTPDLDEALFFHASELSRPEEEKDKPFMDYIKPGDEVQFVVGQNTGARSNLVAQQVQKLPPNSVKAQILSDDCYQGRVIKELNSGSWRSESSGVGRISFQCQAEGKPIEERQIDFHSEDVYKLRQMLKKGTVVQFYVCTDNQTRAQRAVHVEMMTDGSSAAQHPAEKMLHGFIKDISKSGGVIRCLELDKRFTFKTAEVSFEPQSHFERGSAVMFTIASDQKNNERVCSLVALPEGSLSAEKSLGKFQGRVVRPLGGGKGTELGLIVTPKLPTVRATFSSDASSSPDLDVNSLELDDEVEFDLLDNIRLDLRVAQRIQVLCKAREKRELGQVRTKKSNFGFVACCQRSGQLFFHSSALLGCSFEELKKGEDVEFTVERHPERGIMAVRVKRVPQGSAVFETISEAKYKGHILTPPAIISQGVTSSGVLEFLEDGQPSKLLFTASDFKEEVRTGDYVSFQIADNVKAAKQVESLGSTVSRMIGRRATNGFLVKYSGIVRQALQGFGYIKYTEPGSDSEKRIVFNSNDVMNQFELKSGDEVTFVHTKGPKMKEDLARKVVRTKEAPVASPEDTPKPTPKSVSNLAPLVVKTPAMPDGTRGFHMGRGGKLATPPPQSSADTLKGGVGELVGTGNPTSNGHNADRSRLHAERVPNSSSASPQPPDARKGRKSKPVQKDQGRTDKQSNHPTALLKAPLRTASGHSLNPHAVEFQPSVSGLQLTDA